MCRQQADDRRHRLAETLRQSGRARSTGPREVLDRGAVTFSRQTLSPRSHSNSLMESGGGFACTVGRMAQRRATVEPWAAGALAFSIDRSAEALAFARRPSRSRPCPRRPGPSCRAAGLPVAGSRPPVLPQSRHWSDKRSRGTPRASAPRRTARRASPVFPSASPRQYHWRLVSSCLTTWVARIPRGSSTMAISVLIRTMTRGSSSANSFGTRRPRYQSPARRCGFAPRMRAIPEPPLLHRLLLA